MKPVTRSEILDLGAYEQIRERFRARVIAEKKTRRVALGPTASALFENHCDTVLLQIQEMLRTERITKESAVEHEIATYNALIPGKNELSATVFIEIDDPAERERFLVAAAGFERHVAIAIDGERFSALWEKERELLDCTSAVHYLRFPLAERAALALAGARSGSGARVQVELRVDHPVYSACVPLAQATVESLAEDLDER